MPLKEQLSPEQSKRCSNRPRVLVADDHQSVLEKVVSLLQPHFEIVGTASNGQVLIEIAQRLQPDIVVSDILMPCLNGIEAAHHLRESGSTAKWIFLSIYERSEFVSACFAEGASGYVSKAKMSTDLVFAINEAMNGRQFVSSSVQIL